MLKIEIIVESNSLSGAKLEVLSDMENATRFELYYLAAFSILADIMHDEGPLQFPAKFHKDLVELSFQIGETLFKTKDQNNGD